MTNRNPTPPHIPSPADIRREARAEFSASGFALAGDTRNTVNLIGGQVWEEITAADALDQTDRAKQIEVTSGTFTLGLFPSALLGNGWWVDVYNSGSGVVTLDPDGSETIDGAATLAVAAGGSVHVMCTGTAFETRPTATATAPATTTEIAEVVATTEAAGTSNTWARGDHVHSIANRTRTVPLVPYWDMRTGAVIPFVTTNRGNLNPNTNNIHIDQANADAAHKQVLYFPTMVPHDFASGLILKWLFSSTVANNNAVFVVTVDSNRATGTLATAVINAATAVTVAVPAAAHTLTLGSQTANTAPTAGDTIWVEIDIATDHANDSNTGLRSLWQAWLEYTADS